MFLKRQARGHYMWCICQQMWAGSQGTGEKGIDWQQNPWNIAAKSQVSMKSCSQIYPKLEWSWMDWSFITAVVQPKLWFRFTFKPSCEVGKWPCAQQAFLGHQEQTGHNRWTGSSKYLANGRSSPATTVGNEEKGGPQVTKKWFRTCAGRAERFLLC